jgi:hypothetical protein
MSLLLLSLALTAAPVDISACKRALAKVITPEMPERIDAFQACGAMLPDQRLRAAWLGVVHTSPFDAGPILGLAAGEPAPAGAKNACARTQSDLAICNPNRPEVERLPSAERALQWRALFMRVLDADFSSAQATELQKLFAEKWPVLFPDARPPGIVTEGPLRVSGNISHLEVLRAIGKVRPQLDQCLATPSSELSLRFVVLADGQLSGFAVFAPFEPARVECLRKAFFKVVMPLPVNGVAIIVWTAPQSGP